MRAAGLLLSIPTLVVVAVVVVVAGSASADSYRYSAHVTGSAAAGYTDNILSVSETPASPGLLGPEADFFYELNPGAFLVYERPTQVHELTYGLSARLFQVKSEANSLTHRIAWRNVSELSVLTSLSAGVSVDFGQVNSFSTQGANDQGVITSTPGGSSRFTAIEAREGVRRSFSHQLRGAQEGWLRRSETAADDAAASAAGYQLGNTLSLDRVWKRDAVAGSFTSTYADLRHEQSDGSFVSDDQIGLSLRATWRRDLSPRWTGNAYGGAATLVDPAGEFDSALQPEGGVAFSYTPEWGRLGISYSRSLAVNLLLAQNTISDRASVQGVLPLPWLSKNPAQPELSISGTLGALRSRSIDLEANQTSGSSNAIVSDLAVNYSPAQSWSLSLRYRYAQQEEDASTAMAFTSYSRNTLMLSLRGRYPGAAAARIATRRASRVDSSDASGSKD